MEAYNHIEKAREIEFEAFKHCLASLSDDDLGHLADLISGVPGVSADVLEELSGIANNLTQLGELAEGYYTR